MHQFEFDLSKGRELRDDGIQRAYAHSDAECYERLKVALWTVIHTMHTFTTDDVLRRFEGEPPREPRVMGALMRKAQAEGFVSATREYRQSDNPACHARPKRVWRSCVLDGKF